MYQTELSEANCPVHFAKMKCASYEFVMTVVGPEENCTGHNTQVHLSFETTTGVIISVAQQMRFRVSVTSRYNFELIPTLVIVESEH